MPRDEVFQLECLKCNAPTKVLKRCIKCGNWCCSECSFNVECIDCFNPKVEVRTYIEEKIKDLSA